MKFPVLFIAFCVFVFSAEIGSSAEFDKTFDSNLRYYEKDKSKDNITETTEFDKDMELALLGNAGGQFRIGTRYLNGVEVSIDYTKALDWLEKAAAQGHSNALYNLGYMYLYGVGVAVDFVEAADYFNRSKDGGFLPAYHILAIMYYDGAGVAKDFNKAQEYCKKAADDGYEPAKKMMKNGIFSPYE